MATGVGAFRIKGVTSLPLALLAPLAQISRMEPKTKGAKPKLLALFKTARIPYTYRKRVKGTMCWRATMATPVALDAICATHATRTDSKKEVRRDPNWLIS